MAMETITIDVEPCAESDTAACKIGADGSDSSNPEPNRLSMPEQSRPPEARRWSMPCRSHKTAEKRSSWGHFFIMCLGATGVVFGDIGTSPLYTITGICGQVDGCSPNSSFTEEDELTSVFSLIFWTLTIVVLFKYILLVMQISHNGEGGTFGLMQVMLSRVGKSEAKLAAAMTTLGMLGSALLFGDGVITPVESILGAIEGIPEGTNEIDRSWICVGILVVLFAVQSFGSRTIGLCCGPILCLWFITIAAIGVYNVAAHPHEAGLIARGFNPYWIYWWWAKSAYKGFEAWKSLAGVSLTVTGAEALYADLGHFGRAPIVAAWVCFVFPCLILQYLGQLTAIKHDPSVLIFPHGGPFYGAAPQPVRIPLLVLAILAAVIASQALLSGVFSVLTQAASLGFLPRTRVVHTNQDAQGQVYIPSVNVVLLVLCCVTSVTFQTSAALAGAYGIAVTIVFLLTTTMAAMVMVRVWEWPWYVVALVCSPLVLVDVMLSSSNLTKFVDRGWYPIAIAAVVFTILAVHNWGRNRERALLQAEKEPDGDVTSCVKVVDLPAAMRQSRYSRTRTTGIYLTPYEWRVPRSLGRLAAASGSLPETIVLLRVRFQDVPFVAKVDRTSVQTISAEQGLYQVTICFGYAEPVQLSQTLHNTLMAELKSNAAMATASPDMHYVLHRLHYCIDEAPTCFRAHGILVNLYAFMKRNECPAVTFFGLEANSALEVSTVRAL